MATGIVYPGRVVAVEAGGPRVTVPLLGGSAWFGPLPTGVADLAVDEMVAVINIGTSKDQLYILGRMAARPPNLDEIPGLDARLDAIEVKDVTQDARLTTGETTDTTQNGRLTTVEGRATAVEGRATSLETRTTAVESKNTTQDTRLTAVETTDGTQNTRLTSVEGRATSLETRTTAVEGVNTTQGTSITANGTAITQLRADTAGKAAAKGDLLIATGAGVLTNHAVPANGLSLVADSTAADGWAAKDQLGMPRALTGAVAATRYVGATTGGAPTTGAFLLGDFVVDQGTGETWVCTVAGSPGTWVSSLAALRTAVFGGPTRTRAPACSLTMGGASDRVLVASTDTYQDSQWAVGSDPDALFHSGAQPTNGYIQVPIAGRYDVEHLALMGGIANAFCIARIVLNTIATGSFVATDIRQVVSGLSEPFVVRARLYERVLAANDKLYFAVWSSGASTVYRTSFGVRTSVALRWVGPS